VQVSPQKVPDQRPSGRSRYMRGGSNGVIEATTVCDQVDLLTTPVTECPPANYRVSTATVLHRHRRRCRSHDVKQAVGTCDLVSRAADSSASTDSVPRSAVRRVSTRFNGKPLEMHCGAARRGVVPGKSVDGSQYRPRRTTSGPGGPLAASGWADVSSAFRGVTRYPESNIRNARG